MPMDIEFIVHDVFTLTRPQWKLASNIEEATAAFQLAMSQDQKTSGTEKIPEMEDPESEGSSADAAGDGEADIDDLSESDEASDVSSNMPYFMGLI